MRNLPFWLALPAVLGACGSDSTPPPAPPAKVTLAISKLLPRDSQIWCPEGTADTEACDARSPEPVVIGCDRQLGVSVDVENFSLRVPDVCGTSAQCGHLSLTIDPDTAPITITGAAKTLLFDRQALEALATLEGEHVLRPALRLASDRPFNGPFVSEPLDVPVTFELADCSGATGGTGGSAGMPGAGGTGGSGTGGSGGTNPGGSGGEATSGAAGEPQGGSGGEGASGAGGELGGGMSGGGASP